MQTRDELLQWVLGEIEDVLTDLQKLDTTNADDQEEFARICDKRLCSALNGLENETTDGPGWVMGC